MATVKYGFPETGCGSLNETFATTEFHNPEQP
jgi:hypothetical protein